MLHPALWPLALIGCVPPAPPSDPPDTDPVDTDLPPAFADLPTGAWSYVGVPGMVCGDGSPTGIGVHPGSSEEVLLLVQGDGRVLEGTAKQIVEAMHYVAFGQEQRTLSEYIDWAVDQASRMNELDLKVEGETDDEKAASLVEAMLGAGLAEKV